MTVSFPERSAGGPRETFDVLAYDVETSGTDVRHDQILQFGSVFANASLQPISRTSIGIRRLPYVVPAPEALAITKLDPFDLDLDHRMDEFDAAKAIRSLFRPSLNRNRVLLTFNGPKFDDEFLRMLFFRNLLDPWATSGAQIRRVDVLAMARLARFLQPGCLSGELNDDGNPIWKLESLCRANGIEIEAHDALSDAAATLALARMIRDRVPFAWAKSSTCGNANAMKDHLSRLARSQAPAWMFSHFSEATLTPILVLGDNEMGKWLVADLRKDPSSLSDEIERIDEHAYGKDTPFRILKSNAAPILISEDECGLVGSRDIADANACREKWISRPRVVKSALEALRRSTFELPEAPTSEESLYAGFPGYRDRDRMAEFHRVAAGETRWKIAFEDPRLSDFAARLVTRLHPEMSVMVGDTLKDRCGRALSRPFGDATTRWGTLSNRSASADERWRTWAEHTFNYSFAPSLT